MTFADNAGLGTLRHTTAIRRAQPAANERSRGCALVENY
jgi:hypothetical protein